MSKEIFFIGPEGSGHHMMRRLLLWHPDVEKTAGSSYPHGVPEKCQFPNLLSRNPETTVALLLTRDKHCQQASCKRRGFYQHRQEVMGETAKQFNDLDLVQKVIFDQLCRWKGKVVWCSYEAMVLWKAVYLRHILEELELDLTIYPWGQVAVKDANEKYFKENDDEPERRD